MFHMPFKWLFSSQIKVFSLVSQAVSSQKEEKGGMGERKRGRI